MKARLPEKYARIGSDKIMTAAIKSEVRKSAADMVYEVHYRQPHIHQGAVR